MKPLEDLARDAGMEYEPHGDEWIDGERLAADGVSLTTLARFRSLCRAEAMEEAARLCERRYMGDNNREDLEAQRCAAAIREAAKEQEC